MAEETLRAYGLRRVAGCHLEGDGFQVVIEDAEAVAQDRCIYALVLGGEIVRVGSSKNVLRKRLLDWQRDVSRAMRGERSPTPFAQARTIREMMEAHGPGAFYARRGTEVDTPVGTFPAYLDEESVLIGRHLPRLNASKHR